MIKLPDSTVIKKYRTIWIFLHYLINLIVQDQWKGGHCFLVRTSRCIQFQSRESRVRLLPLTPMLSETNPELRHFEMVPPLDTAQIPSPLATSPPNLCCPGTHIWNLGQTLLQLWRFFGLSRPEKESIATHWQGCGRSCFQCWRHSNQNWKVQPIFFICKPATVGTKNMEEYGRVSDQWRITIWICASMITTVTTGYQVTSPKPTLLKLNGPNGPKGPNGPWLPQSLK